jgi:DNA (cytosine-5)-methyltransferase 1
MDLTCLSLFTGIGGLDPGLERAGIRVVGQVERDPYRRLVLARHWPSVPRHDDVRTAPAWWAAGIRPRVDMVCGGFPCQPFSTAGHRKGIGDERWGWPWMVPVIRLVRPRFVVLENVAAIAGDWDAFGIILSDLADIGMDARWSVLSACAMGAPHTRERMFTVAYADGEHGSQGLGTGHQRTLWTGDRQAGAWRDEVDRAMATGTPGGRADDGIPAGLDGRRVAALGDAVVPDVAEWIGRAIRSRFFLTG